MKKRNLKTPFLIFSMLIGNYGIAQLSETTSNSEIQVQTQVIDGHEILIFDKIEDKEAWIIANPEAYAIKLEEAEQVSSTYIGTLLQVKETSVQKSNSWSNEPKK